MTTGTTGSRRAQIDQLVTAMMAHLTADGIDLDELAEDPSAVIATVDDLVFQWVNTDTIGGGCSVAALYSGTEHPPRISVARDASAGRRAFSALHEFGHHLCRRVTTVSDALFELPDGGHSIEEDLVDAFAAAVLLPQHTVTTGFADGVDAAAVIQLWRSTAASREACCVAAAQQLPVPGYVMLLQRDGHCQFAAPQRRCLSHRTQQPPDSRQATTRTPRRHSPRRRPPQPRQRHRLRRDALRRPRRRTLRLRRLAHRLASLGRAPRTSGRSSRRTRRLLRSLRARVHIMESQMPAVR